MLEVKVTRKCNICGKVMANENYWSCERSYAESGEYAKQSAVYATTTTINGIAAAAPTKTDVCLGCWDKMRELEPKGHP